MAKRLWRKRSVDLFDPPDSSESSSDESEIPVLKIRKTRRNLSLRPCNAKNGVPSNKENIPSNSTWSSKMIEVDENDKKQVCLSVKQQAMKFVEISKETNQCPESGTRPIKVPFEEISNTADYCVSSESCQPCSTLEREKEDFEAAFESMYDVLDFFKDYLPSQEEVYGIGKFEYINILGLVNRHVYH